MITNINKHLAEQIVSAIKDVCNYDINYIDRAGIILASTDASRVGSFHEIGHRVAQSGTTLEAAEDDTYAGTRKGINMPLYHEGQLLAVIGITGEPDKVRKYAYLAERITNLLIREQELGQFSRRQSDKRHYMVQALIHGDMQNQTYLTDSLKEYNIDLGSQYRAVLIKVNKRYNLANISLLEQRVERLFTQMGAVLYTFLYPEEFVAVISEELFRNMGYMLRTFASNDAEIFDVAIGRTTTLFHTSRSYASAVMACRTIAGKDTSYVVFDDLTLEIVMVSLSDSGKEAFIRKTIKTLSEQERDILRVYYEEEMSLAAVSERLFLHKNTVQYRLNSIHDKCGLNPRRFQDAVLLYLALRMQDLG